MSLVTSGGKGERVRILSDGKGLAGLTQGLDISPKGMCQCGSTRVNRCNNSDR